MLKKEIKYFDFDGNERTENFYFNLTKAECMEMELGTSGGIQQMVEKVIETQDNKKLVEIFKEIILRSYGEKSPDGKHFYKSPEISAAFASTEAYSELFVELATNADEAAKFISGVIPQISETDAKVSDFKSNVIPKG